MLILREYREDEIKTIKDILLKENIKDFQFKGIIYVILEDEDLIGIGKVLMVQENWVLKHLIIREDKRGEDLGDGLLRAILSKLDNINVRFLYYDKENPYLIKKGFKSGKEYELQLNIPEFFKSGCKNCGDCNGL